MLCPVELRAHRGRPAASAGGRTAQSLTAPVRRIKLTREIDSPEALRLQYAPGRATSCIPTPRGLRTMSTTPQELEARLNDLRDSL